MPCQQDEAFSRSRLLEERLRTLACEFFALMPGGLVEMTDFRDAQRSYEANLNVITATRRMLQRTLDILKS